jgi:hypothetical protein
VNGNDENVLALASDRGQTECFRFYQGRWTMRDAIAGIGPMSHETSPGSIGPVDIAHLKAWQ